MATISFLTSGSATESQPRERCTSLSVRQAALLLTHSMPLLLLVEVATMARLACAGSIILVTTELLSSILTA
jgi:hypothetical protein